MLNHSLASSLQDDSAQVWLFFGDLMQSEKISEIKPPLFNFLCSMQFFYSAFDTHPGKILKKKVKSLQTTAYEEVHTM